VSMPGYTSQKVQLKRTMRGGILVLDIITCCASVIVDAVTGGWWKLEPDVLSVSLAKVAAIPGPETVTVTIDTRDARRSASVRIDSTTPGVRLNLQRR
jgi:hypothetical protein